jgi:hypothetical protein
MTLGVNDMAHLAFKSKRACALLIDWRMTIGCVQPAALTLNVSHACLFLLLVQRG